MCFWQRPLNFSDTEFSWFGDLLHLLCTLRQRPHHPVSAAAALISTPQEERDTIAATTPTSTTAASSSLKQAYAVNGDKFSTFPVFSIAFYSVQFCFIQSSSVLLCFAPFFSYFLVNVLFSNKKITFHVDIYSFLMHSHSYSSHDSSIDAPNSLRLSFSIENMVIWMKTNIWKILSRMGYTTTQSKSILYCRGWMNQDDANRIE